VLTTRPGKSQSPLATYSRRRLKIALVLLAIVGTAYVLLNGEQGLLKVREKRAELIALQVQVTQLEAINDSLRQVVWRLENDPEYVEKLARERYGMAKPGERVYRLREGSTQKEGSADE
jgi:cell division protein FtsB